MRVLLLLVCALGTTAEADRRDRDVALQLSGVGLLVPTTTFVVVTGITSDLRWSTRIAIPTLLVGPSLGHWYAGRIVTGGLLVRAAGAGIAALGLASLASEDGEAGPGGGLFYLGAGLVLAGGIYDAATAGRAVDDRNRVSVVPLVHPASAGLGIAGTF